MELSQLSNDEVLKEVGEVADRLIESDRLGDVSNDDIGLFQNLLIELNNRSQKDSGLYKAYSVEYIESLNNKIIKADGVVLKVTTGTVVGDLTDDEFRLKMYILNKLSILLKMVVSDELSLVYVQQVNRLLKEHDAVMDHLIVVGYNRLTDVELTVITKGYEVLSAFRK